jgi:hypothetical protein
MSTDTNNNIEKSLNVSIPPDLLTDVKEVADYYTYDFNTNSAKNCMKVGIMIFRQNKEQFRELVQKYSENAN